MIMMVMMRAGWDGWVVMMEIDGVCFNIKLHLALGGEFSLGFCLFFWSLMVIMEYLWVMSQDVCVQEEDERREGQLGWIYQRE